MMDNIFIKLLFFLVLFKNISASCPNHVKLLSFEASNLNEHCRNQIDIFLNALKSKEAWAGDSKFYAFSTNDLRYNSS
jgi:hypothetical protein